MPSQDTFTPSEWTAGMAARLATDASQQASAAMYREILAEMRRRMPQRSAEPASIILLAAVTDAAWALRGMAQLTGVSVAQIADERRTARDSRRGSQPDTSTPHDAADDKEL